jgi:hypothetical protein
METPEPKILHNTELVTSKSYRKQISVKVQAKYLPPTSSSFQVYGTQWISQQNFVFILCVYIVHMPITLSGST